MWLPDKLYEALPWAYVLIGALFIAGVAYLDQAGYGMLVFAALGGACVAAGLLVHTARVRIRRRSERGDDASGNPDNATTDSA